VLRAREDGVIPRTHRQIRLPARPAGYPTEGDVPLVESPVPEPGPRESLARVVCLWLDPDMRGRMSAARSCVPPVALGLPGAAARRGTEGPR
jgi:NADPH-dependent curcumin reductase